MSDIPALPARKSVTAKDDKPKEFAAPPMTPEEGYEAVPGALEATDAVKHENDILYVTNFALEHGEVRSMSEFLGWMQRQMAQAQRSGMLPTAHPLAPPVPEVETLAKYLRMVGHVQHQPDA